MDSAGDSCCREEVVLPDSIENKFARLIKNGLVTKKTLSEAHAEDQTSAKPICELLIERGVPKHEILFSLAEYYECRFIEYEEGLTAPSHIIKRLEASSLKKLLWFPLSAGPGDAEVIASNPGSPDLIAEIRDTLGVERIRFIVALPSDLIRIIDNSLDVNPVFPASAGRTQLAKVRTFLANRRSMLSCCRTYLAMGRTGLSFLRTGLSFITIALLLFKTFYVGYSSLFELLLLMAGTVMAFDGMRWYWPIRGLARKRLAPACPSSESGTTVLEVVDPDGDFHFSRSAPIRGAEALRGRWDYLSPVIRRRYLANDRTDLAEERTHLAFFRTLMSKSRTGLALSRTGIALVGIGIALLRQINGGQWNLFTYSLVITGVLMIMEGLYWYFPGRRAEKESLTAETIIADSPGIWDRVLPPMYRHSDRENSKPEPPPLKPGHMPGVWGTTGLALERTLLAERRNVMARLRTTMARSRTGLGFIRTGINFSAVGLGLMVSFGVSNALWTIVEAGILFIGLAMTADGLYWYIPAERMRRLFPYCFGEMEIALPDYTRPVRSWEKVVFSHDDEK